MGLADSRSQRVFFILRDCLWYYSFLSVAGISRTKVHFGWGLLYQKEDRMCY